MVMKCGHLILPGAFPDKIISGINFTDKAVVQCDVPVVKILLWVLLIYIWSQINFDVNTRGITLKDPVLCIEIDRYILRSWLHKKELAS